MAEASFAFKIFCIKEEFPIASAPVILKRSRKSQALSGLATLYELDGALGDGHAATPHLVLGGNTELGVLELLHGEGQLQGELLIQVGKIAV